MFGCYRVVTDGKVFRIQQIVRGDRTFVSDFNKVLEFRTKEEAENYIHTRLSDSGWHEA